MWSVASCRVLGPSGLESFLRRVATREEERRASGNDGQASEPEDQRNVGSVTKDNFRLSCSSNGGLQGDILQTLTSSEVLCGFRVYDELSLLLHPRRLF